MKKWGASIASGNTPKKEQTRMRPESIYVGAELAISTPHKPASRQSAIIILILSLLGLPYFLVSVLMWGFQWGVISSRKWLAKDSGIARSGLVTLAAIAAATITWGVSSTSRAMI